MERASEQIIAALMYARKYPGVFKEDREIFGLASALDTVKKLIKNETGRNNG